jgi:hypothetical protein
MTVHWRGFLVFAAFAAVLAVANEPGVGLLALVACLIVEGLLWGGVAGFGRPNVSKRP